MATRSRIGIQIGDKVHHIYCHWDGYPEGVGNELVTRFNSRELAEGLIKMGNRSWLIQPAGYTPASDELYDEPAEIVSKEYWSDYTIDTRCGEEYVYEWRDDLGWIVYDINLGERYPLTVAE